MANKKKQPPHPCDGCEKDKKQCIKCEHAHARALAMRDAEVMQREVRTSLIAGDLPYDRQTYIFQVKFLMQKTAETIIEVGKRLLVMQEKEGHGNFLKILEDDLNMHYRTAYRFMNIAIKSERYPKIELSKFDKLSNLYALIEAPEEDLKELEEKGVLAGKDMDELQRMSVKEMRELIKDLKEKAQSIANQLTEEKDLEIKALRKEIKRLSAMSPDEKDASWSVKYLEDLDKLLNEVDLKLRRFAFDKRILDHPELQQRIVEINEGLLFRLRQFSEDFDALITETEDSE